LKNQLTYGRQNGKMVLPIKKAKKQTQSHKSLKIQAIQILYFAVLRLP